MVLQTKHYFRPISIPQFPNVSTWQLETQYTAPQTREKTNQQPFKYAKIFHAFINAKMLDALLWASMEKRVRWISGKQHRPPPGVSAMNTLLVEYH